MRKYAMKDILPLLDEVVGEWFSGKFKSLTEPQEYAIPLIHEGKNVLVCAPTGSGKTLTAFLTIINELFIMAREGRLGDGVICVYVSPLKALANDIERNLNEPLREIRELASKKGLTTPEIRVGVRTGDTSQSERQRQVAHPPHIYITTPESFSLVLTARKPREMLKRARYMIVDEIHDLCPNKRGTMLSISMERLCDLTVKDVVRIGLSATQAPIEEIGRFLGGYDDKGRPRPVEIVDIPGQKSLDLKVLCPVDDLTRYAYDVSNARMYDLLIDTISKHKTTLVFTNTRSGAESVTYKLRERGVEFVATHHGSLGKEIRHDVERGLKEGELRAVVTSTSLELGIDIGHIEIVVQVGSPKSVAKGIQRVGRAGHRYGSTSSGLFIVFDTDDLIECTVLTKCAKEKRIDRIDLPKGSLDVLAQVIVALSIEKKWNVKELHDLLKKSYSYHELEMNELKATLDYLSGRQFGDTLYGKIWYDPEEQEIGRKRGGRMIFFLNMGTIPDEADYLVVDENKKIIGDLSEPFVERLEAGDVFVLGGRSYEFLGERKMRVYVRNALGRKPTVPSWTGEMLPRSFDLSVEIARFRKGLQDRLSRDQEVFHWLKGNYLIDDESARSIESYALEQMKVMRFIPNIETLCLEGYLDPSGNANIVFHFPFGRRVNDALSRAYAYRISGQFKCNVRISVTDDAFMLTAPKRIPLEKIANLVRSKDLSEILARAVRSTELFKQRFRHCASRALMVLRNYKGHDISVARQFLRSQKLLDVLHGIEEFPVIKETYQEIMTIVMDLPHAREVLGWIEGKRCAVKVRNYTSFPSPFAHNIILAGASDMVLMEDRALLLKELHRQVLARMFGDIKPYRFEPERVREYFTEKFGTIRSKGDILKILRKGGAFTFSMEKGKNIYRYSGSEYAKVRKWGDELLAEGKLASCYTTESQHALPEDVPAYMTLYRRGFTLQENEKRALELIAKAGKLSTAELREKMRLSSLDVHDALRTLEASYRIERACVSEKEGVFWKRCGTKPIEKALALERVVRHTLATEGPLTSDEVASRLRMEEEEVQEALDSYVREGWVLRDMFLLGEREQYMLSSDVIRIQEGRSGDVLDPVEIRQLLCSRQFVPDARTFFERMVFTSDAFEVAMHCETFDMESWKGMLRSGEVVYVKIGGAWRYMLGNDAHALSGTFVTSDELKAQRERVFGILGRNRWIPDATLSSYLGSPGQEGADIITNLIERCALARTPPELEEELGYGLAPVEGGSGMEFDELVVRYLFGVPSSTSDLASAFGVGTDEARDLVERLRLSEKVRKVKALTREGGVRELWTSGELDGKGAEATRLLHPDDVFLRSIGRKEDGYALVRGPEVIGSVELWAHDDHVAIPDVRCDDLEGFFDALDHAMVHYKSTGIESVRIDAHDSVEWKADDMFPKGSFAFEKGRLYHGMLPLEVSESNMISYVLERQRVNALASPEEMLQELHGIRSIFELGLRMTGSRRYDPASRFPKLYEGYDVSGVKVFSRMAEFAIFHAAKKKDHLTTHENEVLNAIRVRPGSFEDDLYDIVGLGEGTFYQSLGRLEAQDHVVRGWKGRIFSVPDQKISRSDARAIVVRWLFHEYGAFTLKRLLEYCAGAFPKGEMLSILNGLVREGYLARFSIDNELHYVLSSDPSKAVKRQKDGTVDLIKDALDSQQVHLDQRLKLPGKVHKGMIVLSPDDRLFAYFEPMVRKRFKLRRCWLVIKDGEMIGVFRARLSRSRLHVSELRGGKEVQKAMHAFARQWGFRMMGRIEGAYTSSVEKDEHE